MQPTKILVTGATGFIGRALLDRLRADPVFDVSAVVRHWLPSLPSDIQVHEVGDLNASTDLRGALTKVDVVIHAAARAHVLREEASNPLTEFRRVNVDATLNLARQAAEAGVKRFIFISSIGVNGAETLDEPFSEISLPAPVTDYAISKYEAEQALQQLLQTMRMELVIIRPPLVYGPDAPGNFGRLLRLVASGLPLPLGGISNRRSLIARENLVDFIITCVSHPKAAGEVFLVSDGQDLSTTELVRQLAKGMGKRLLLLPVPTGMLKFAATMLGRQSVYQQLCGSLRVDSGKARAVLNWTPPLSVNEALRKTAAHFVAQQRT